MTSMNVYCSHALNHRYVYVVIENKPLSAGVTQLHSRLCLPCLWLVDEFLFIKNFARMPRDEKYSHRPTTKSIKTLTSVLSQSHSDVRDKIHLWLNMILMYCQVNADGTLLLLFMRRFRSMWTLRHFNGALILFNQHNSIPKIDWPVRRVWIYLSVYNTVAFLYWNTMFIAFGFIVLTNEFNEILCYLLNFDLLWITPQGKYTCIAITVIYCTYFTIIEHIQVYEICHIICSHIYMQNCLCSR